MAARNLFPLTLFTSSFQGKLLFYEIFSRQKSLFVVLLAKEKKCLSNSICGAEKKIL